MEYLTDELDSDLEHENEAILDGQRVNCGEFACIGNNLKPRCMNEFRKETIIDQITKKGLQIKKVL